MKIGIKLIENGFMPIKATDGAAAYDLIVPEDTVVQKGRSIIQLNFIIELPKGYKAEIHPRSGYSSKGFVGYYNYSKDSERRYDCDVKHGLIDSDYRGNVGVILNNNDETFYIRRGQRIAQMIINKVEDSEFELINEVNETKRGESGFGSTGR